MPPVSAVIFRFGSLEHDPSKATLAACNGNSEYAFFGVGMIVGGGSPSDEARAAHERRGQLLGAYGAPTHRAPP